MPLGNDKVPGEFPEEDGSGDNMLFGLDGKDSTPTTMEGWLALSSAVYETSQDYYEQSLQKNWEDSARHWNNKHASDSKFNSETYRFRSRLFRPLTRTSERNSSASTAAAMFSNMDTVSVKPVNPNSPNSGQGAAITKSLLEYRLKYDVKWYLTAMGAWQDAYNYGPCISYVSWDYQERPKAQEQPEATVLDLSGMGLDLEEMGAVVISEGDQEEDDLRKGDFIDDYTGEEDGLTGEPEEFGGMRESMAQALGEEVPEIEPEMEVVVDKLCIDLVPPEYFRADPTCDWRDVVNSSPYIIRIVQMPVVDVESKMASGEWLKLERGEILASSDRNLEYDGVRRAREGDDRADSVDDMTRTSSTDFEIVFAHENFIRLEGREWVFWTLGKQYMLTEPKPLEEVYFHGKRPLVYGYSVIEAHKYAPNGQNILMKDLQESVNDIANQRQDNVKLAMNKRYVVRRGSQVDLQALARNVPGGSVTADNPAEDVQVVSTPDVTSSSYEEVDRLTVEANEIAGSFSGSSVQSNRALNETVGGMQLLNEGANQLQEFDIRTWVETWVKPTLQLGLITVQAYENDENIISVAGEQGLEKFDENSIDELFPNREDLWNIPMNLEVNVGLGATSPFQRVNNLQTGLNMVAPYVDPMTIKKEEIVKEVMAAAGYNDGSRFIMTKEEAAQNAQDNPPPLPPEAQAKQMEVQAKQQFEQMKMQFEMQKEQMRLDAQMQMKQMEIEANNQLKMVEIAAKGDITMKQLQAKMAEAQMTDKTKRDTTAVQEGTKQNEMALKREMGEGI